MRNRGNGGILKIELAVASIGCAFGFAHTRAVGARILLDDRRSRQAPAEPKPRPRVILGRSEPRQSRDTVNKNRIPPRPPAGWESPAKANVAISAIWSKKWTYARNRIGYRTSYMGIWGEVRRAASAMRPLKHGFRPTRRPNFLEICEQSRKWADTRIRETAPPPARPEFVFSGSTLGAASTDERAPDNALLGDAEARNPRKRDIQESEKV